MMKVLVAEPDAEIRDQMSVGLSAFDDVEVDEALGVAALDRVRRTDYQFAIIGIELTDNAGRDLFEKVRAVDVDLDVLILAPQSIIEHLHEEKLRGLITGFLKRPLDPVEFFRTVGRVRQRRRGSPTARAIP